MDRGSGRAHRVRKLGRRERRVDVSVRRWSQVGIADNALWFQGVTAATLELQNVMRRSKGEFLDLQGKSRENARTRTFLRDLSPACGLVWGVLTADFPRFANREFPTVEQGSPSSEQGYRPPQSRRADTDRGPPSFPRQRSGARRLGLESVLRTHSGRSARTLMIRATCPGCEAELLRKRRGRCLHDVSLATRLLDSLARMDQNPNP